LGRLTEGCGVDTTGSGSGSMAGCCKSVMNLNRYLI
jgi:hypothetical protein